MKKHNLLVVDDEQDSVDALERLFRKKFKVLKATRGQEALDLLKDNDVSLIISDQRMPEMEGVEFLKKSIELRPHAIRLLLTGYTDIESVIGAINSGEVYKYVTKPWDPVDLTNTIDKAQEKYELRQELHQKNQELQSALTELQSLDAAKSQFMILINHELKTPLTVISSYLQLAQESKPNDDLKMYLDKITASTGQLTSIIERVLELISARTGQREITLKSFDIDKQINPIVKQLTPLAQQRNITFDTSDLSGNAKLDEKILTSVITELLTNCASFANKDSEVVIKSEKNEEGLEVIITNQGPKLDSQIIESILKPFALNEDSMNHSKGLGLGLSLCQALLEVMGSQLILESSEEQFQAKFMISK